MNNKDYPASLWLMPDEPSATELNHIIKSIASETQTIAFPAHLTLASGFSLTVAESLDTESITEFLPITAEIKSIEISDSFFQSFYLSFDQTPFELIRIELAKRLNIKPEFDPHLSLAYLDEYSVKEKLKMNYTIQLSKLTFNQIRKVYTKTNWADIESWQEI